VSARVRTGAVVAIAASLLLALVLFRFFPSQEEKDADPLPTSKPISVKIGKVTGRVERLRQDETWTPAREGEDIALDERVRTGDDGTAVLNVGGQSTITLQPKTEASVAKLTETVSQLRLQKGRVRAVTEEGRSVEVLTGSSDVRVDSTGASDFVAMADGLGGLVVASREGKVRLTALGASVDVAPGQQSSASRESAPTQPSPIPSTLFLKLLPVAAEAKSADTTITVKTQRGSRVRVNGVDVGIATGETMDVPVHLEPGENRILIEVEDLTGRIANQEITIRLTGKDPIEIRTSVTW